MWQIKNPPLKIDIIRDNKPISETWWEYCYGYHEVEVL